MKLIVHELATSLEQVVTPDKDTLVVAIRPHLYRHNFAAGSLKIQILDGLTVVAESDAVDISDIGSMDYFHGYVRFEIKAYLTKDTAYTIKLVSQGGYSFSESSYVGWVNGHDLAKYPINGTPVGHYQYPLDYEVWEKSVK